MQWSFIALRKLHNFKASGFEFSSQDSLKFSFKRFTTNSLFTFQIKTFSRFSVKPMYANLKFLLKVFQCFIGCIEVSFQYFIIIILSNFLMVFMACQLYWKSSNSFAYLCFSFAFEQNFLSALSVSCFHNTIWHLCATIKEVSEIQWVTERWKNEKKYLQRKRLSDIHGCNRR